MLASSLPPKVRPVDCLRKGGVVATGNSAVAGVAEVLTQKIFFQKMLSQLARPQGSNTK